MRVTVAVLVAVPLGVTVAVEVADEVADGVWLGVLDAVGDSVAVIVIAIAVSLAVGTIVFSTTGGGSTLGTGVFVGPITVIVPVATSMPPGPVTINWTLYVPGAVKV